MEGGGRKREEEEDEDEELRGSVGSSFRQVCLGKGGKAGKPGQTMLGIFSSYIHGDTHVELYVCRMLEEKKRENISGGVVK